MNIKAPVDDKQLEDDLMAAVPRTGTIGNVSLLQKLKWEDATYWTVRNRLIESNQLLAGRGRGGSVRRVVETPPETLEAQTSQVATPLSEADLYEPTLAVIRRDWAESYRYADFHAELTAHQGRRDTGGKWSRPDITLATYDSYEFVPGKHFDVITFEVKTFAGLNVTAIYEALSHRRAAHYAFVLAYVPNTVRDSFESIIEDLEEEAGNHGIGLVVFADHSDYKTWEFLSEAERNDPDPRDVNDFLDDQISQQFKDKIRRWFR